MNALIKTSAAAANLVELDQLFLGAMSDISDIKELCAFVLYTHEFYIKITFISIHLFTFRFGRLFNDAFEFSVTDLLLWCLLSISSSLMTLQSKLVECGIYAMTK